MDIKEIYFSIIMPTYNRASMIGKAIGSILNQEYTNFELIIVNDGGEDHTEEIVRSFRDPRIKYYYKENEQKSIAKNFGFDQARGQYVSSFDDDDIMYPHHLSTALRLIEQYNHPEAVYVHYDILNEVLQHTAIPKPISGAINELIVAQNPLSNNGVFLRKDITSEYRYYHSASLKMSADWLLWLRFLAKYPMYYTNEATHGVVAHQQRGSASAKVDVYINNKRIFLEQLRGDPIFMKRYPGALKNISAYYDTYIALFLSLQGNKINALQYLSSGILQNPKEILRRRFLAIVKYLIIKW